MSSHLDRLLLFALVQFSDDAFFPFREIQFMTYVCELLRKILVFFAYRRLLTFIYAHENI